MTWLAVFPTITMAQWLLGTSVAHLALPVRTLIVTALVVPVVSYVMLPRIVKAEARLARRVRHQGR
jgi:antibiotic biosynthesis monooxygenase (ABM) superfamily enzyme